jgi:hypothetical protein
MIFSYDPLCVQLEAKKHQKAELMKKLEACEIEERRVMGEMKTTVNNRKIDDSKLVRKMVSMQLKTLRGYGLDSSSTFHQTK